MHYILYKIILSYIVFSFFNFNIFDISFLKFIFPEIKSFFIAISHNFLEYFMLSFNFDKNIKTSL